MPESPDESSADAPAGKPDADRRSSDRRAKERRKAAVPTPVERRGGTERRTRQRRARKGPNQYELSEDELEFIRAINVFKEKTGRPFPTWSEVLTILRELGYEKS